MQKLFFDADARNRIVEGAGILRRAVAVTASPLGRNVVIKKPYGFTTTHDGVTVAESIEVSNPELSVGADIIKEAAGKLNNEVGDGTTTVTMLTYALMEYMNQIIGDDLNAMVVRKDMIAVQEFLLKELKKLTVKLDDEKLIDVATVSVGDVELGNIIGKLALEVGRDGTILVERGSGYKTETEIRKGFTFERSYLSPYFVTDKKKQAAVLERPVILITSEKLRTYDQIDALMSGVTNQDKSVLIICEELTGDALATVVQSHTRNLVQIAAVQAPAFGDARREILQDIAAVTGAEVFSDVQSGIGGRAAQVVITREATTIVGGEGTQTLERVEQIKAQIEEADTDYDKEQLENRISNIIGKIGIVKVGGSSESEADEKKYRVDDAVAAVKAAQLGGIVAGGGIALLNLSDRLADAPLKINRDVRLGVMNALREPYNQILHNSNIDENKINKALGKSKGKGVNVLKPEKGIVDMVEEGIIDPSRVTEKVITTAFSIAMTAITTDVLVVDLPDEV